MGARRKSYTSKYRREAARLVIDTGRTIAEAAREINVGSCWTVSGLRAGRRWIPRLMRRTPRRAELERPRRENDKLRMDREFLKEAAALFAKET